MSNQFTKEWYDAYKLREQQKAYYNSRNSAAKPECNPRKASNGVGKDKASSAARYAVSFKIYRVRKLDPDNTLVKWHIDTLRYCGIILEDTEESIVLTVEQFKVKSYKDQKTVIEVYPIPI